MSDVDAPIAGWYPDPVGRHQHRYWNGSAWTDDVADGGVTGKDPVFAASGTSDAHPAPDAADHSHEPPAVPFPAAAPAPSRGRLPLLIGVFVIVAVIVGAAIVLLRPSDDDDGAGDFTYTVSSEEFTVHSVDLDVGDAMAWRIPDAGNLSVAFGVDEDSLDRMAEADEFSDFLSDADEFASDANSTAYDLLRGSSDLDEDLLDDLSDASSDELFALPGYDGFVLTELDYDELGGESDAVSGTLIASVPMRLDILMIATKGQELVELNIRTASPEDVGDLTELSSDDLDELYSDEFMSDFVDTVRDELDLSDGAEESDDADEGTAETTSPDSSPYYAAGCEDAYDAIESAVIDWSIENTPEDDYYYPDSLDVLVPDYLDEIPATDYEYTAYDPPDPYFELYVHAC